MTKPPKVESAVSSVNRKGVKLRNKPTNPVIAKLSPIEKANRSIKSIPSFFGNKILVRQYPGRKATRINPNVYRI